MVEHEVTMQINTKWAPVKVFSQILSIDSDYLGMTYYTSRLSYESLYPSRII